MRLAYALMTVALTAWGGHRTSETPPRSLRAAVTALRAEGRAAKREGTLPRDEPALGDLLEDAPDPADLAAALAGRLDPDPVVDAYIRWQLTAAAHRVTWDDAGFAALLRAAPGFAPNPRADADLLEFLRVCEDEDSLSPRRHRQLERRLADLDEQAARATRLSHPGQALQAWIHEQLPARGPRRVLWRLAGLDALLRAGWPASKWKGELTRDLRAARATLTEPDRARLLDLGARLAARPERRIAAEVTWLATGRIRVRHERCGFSADNLRTWRRILE